MDLRIESGTLLASMPGMLDPNFMHAVVLMVQHTEEGAYGLVVNKPAGLTIDKLLPKHPLLSTTPFPVHWGGPVGLETMQILHRVPKAIPGGIEIGAGLFLGGELEAAARFASSDVPRASASLRFVVGYSGWGEGQLDMELRTESWLPASLTVDAVFATDQQRTWREVVRSVGGDASGMENLPPDVSWN